MRTQRSVCIVMVFSSSLFFSLNVLFPYHLSLSWSFFNMSCTGPNGPPPHFRLCHEDNVVSLVFVDVNREGRSNNVPTERCCFTGSGGGKMYELRNLICISLETVSHMRSLNSMQLQTHYNNSRAGKFDRLFVMHNTQRSFSGTLEWRWNESHPVKAMHLSVGLGGASTTSCHS